MKNTLRAYADAASARNYANSVRGRPEYAYANTRAVTALEDAREYAALARVYSGETK